MPDGAGRRKQDILATGKTNLPLPTLTRQAAGCALGSCCARLPDDYDEQARPGRISRLD